jgi:RHS repeat-associated protein
MFTGYKFTGKERDSETGLDYFGARHYGPNMGRWMSPDWSAQPSPVPYAKVNDPQTLNLYGYVRNNPLNRFDLDGHDDITYDQHGKELERKNKKGKLWHLFNNDNYSMKAGDKTYKLTGLAGPLKNLGTGTYKVMSAEKTQNLIHDFVGANKRGFGEQRPGIGETIAQSQTNGKWDFKDTKYNTADFYIMGDSAYRPDYVGNVMWGQIMNSYGFTEDFAHFGAGLQQVYHDLKGGRVPTGSINTGGDQPLDYRAIHEGFNQDPL